ncbi:MAG: hypothetical protein KGK33_08360 [Hyphomicrobiales bacterium]|nr:hypothetical protein [Hyphomicrobiales bacterium]MDE2284609.1 hypothetical protein [Hyphomicrobiales bacterium]
MSRVLFGGMLMILFVSGAEARVVGVADPHKYLHNCAEGLVHATCACRATTGNYQVC